MRAQVLLVEAQRYAAVFEARARGSSDREVVCIERRRVESGNKEVLSDVPNPTRYAEPYAICLRERLRPLCSKVGDTARAPKLRFQRFLDFGMLPKKLLDL